MPGRVIEVLTRGTVLTQDRGFLHIERRDDNFKAEVALNDIAVLLVGQGITLSTNLVLALHEQGACIILTGFNFHPASFFWPMAEHGSHCKRLELQIAATQPLQKRLWQNVVEKKITAQAAVLKIHKNTDEGLLGLSTRVKSGDPENLEAQAARRYWQALFGSDFRRLTTATLTADPNILLNYGYAIIRAGMARAISACGLHPALGIFHKNQSNPFRLVDDLVEPYRALVDDKVFTLRHIVELTPDTKKQLAALLDVSLVNHKGENSPASITMLQVAQSFCTSLEEGSPQLNYPQSMLPSTKLL